MWSQLNGYILIENWLIHSKTRYSRRRVILNDSIEGFLAQVEKKAYRMAEIATQNQADALDIVQDTMIKLVEKYSDKPSDEWKPLFYRILQSRIMDYFRRRSVYRRIFFWKNSLTDERETEFSGAEDLIGSASSDVTPEREISGKRNLEQVLAALNQLPARQQQCFLLRSWEGMSVIETAKAMGCSEGSVKTHYSRAKIALKSTLVETFV